MSNGCETAKCAELFKKKEARKLGRDEERLDGA